MKHPKVNPSPLVASTGLPAWATVALDSAIGCGAIRWSDLDGLTSRQLLQVARVIVARQLAPVDVSAVVAEVGEA